MAREEVVFMYATTQLELSSTNGSTVQPNGRVRFPEWPLMARPARIADVSAANRRVVASSTIKSIGYDAEAMILEIEFRRGGVYRYLGVPELLYRRLMACPSKGAFFNSSIAQQFRAEQLDREGP